MKLLTRLSKHLLLSPISRFSFLLIIPLVLFCGACSPGGNMTYWNFEVDFSSQEKGIMKLNQNKAYPTAVLTIFGWETMELENVAIDDQKLSGEFDWFDLEGTFDGDQFTGTLTTRNGEYPFRATKQSDELVPIDRSEVAYLLSDEDLDPIEKDVDHADIIQSWDNDAFIRGSRIYNANCINCHGTPEIEGSIPQSRKFWDSPFKAGSDVYSMYLTLTKGYGTMPPQLILTPQEKYDVILYLQQNFIKEKNKAAYVPATPGYIAGLPRGSTRGPATKPYQPWADMDYGNFFINTYELVDSAKGPERFHSPGPLPYVDEDYLDNNFAYKGIAVRLDQGEGGVSRGKAWMMFDHDLMRVAGGWTGNGFIDWDGILLNDRHETYPRTIGKLHFETPVGPGWANPKTGSFEDPRFRARDGRAFGPLPKDWANYKGLYQTNRHTIISYSVGDADVLELFGVEVMEGGQTVMFTRTLNVSPSTSQLKMRVAPLSNKVIVAGDGATILEEDGFHVLEVDPSMSVRLKLFIADESVDNLGQWIVSSPPQDLQPLTTAGSTRFGQELTGEVIQGNENGPFAIDKLVPPFDNPWASRMKLSGIDFLADQNKAVACTTDGDVWLITGLLENKGTVTWKRMAAGLFQPLGIKVVDEKIFVTCRDQIVLLRDLNGDMETDFYESFNHDHQVSDHFHEFAMGLQADVEGNLYYAKSGRHAREALIPQHGTLLKVSKDGSSTEVIATGFRAANGVCINPDGSFIVTDQQGFWNPMNRINWIEGKGNFYGNMWGYDPPEDTSRAAMEPPMVWVDMEFDRSPSELMWVDSEKWGPLDGALLSFSYGFGKVQLVLPERVRGQMQGGVIDLPDVKFLTGVMRGRFNPADGHLYACGMSAWGTTQIYRGGGLYRVRYTGKPLPVPVGLSTLQSGLELTFASPLDASAEDVDNFEVETWDLVRSSKYGSDRHNRKELTITKVQLLGDGTTVRLFVEGIAPVDVMTISYDLEDKDGNPLKGTVQNTIHRLGGREGV